MNFRSFTYHILFLFCGSMFLYNCSSEIPSTTNRDTKNNLESLDLLRVENTTDNKIILTGEIDAVKKTEVSFPINGKVDNSNSAFQIGDVFKKGDVLIQLDRLGILYEILLKRLEFKELLVESLSEIKNKIPQEYNKWAYYSEQLNQTSSPAPLPEVSSKTEENIIEQLGIFSIFYEVKKLELQAEDYFYIAPFDGIVLSGGITPGQTIQSFKTILTIGKLEDILIQSLVPAQEVLTYKIGEKVNFLSQNQDTIAKGKLERIGEYSPDSSFVEFYFAFTPKLPQNYKKINQVRREQSSEEFSTKLPKTAILNDSIYLFDGNRTYSLAITIEKTQGDSVLVRGIPEGSLIILNPQALKD